MKTPLRLPALDSETVAEVRRSGYPEPYRSRMGDRAKRRLAEAATNTIAASRNGRVSNF